MQLKVNNNNIDINISNNSKVLPNDHVSYAINEMGLYNNERLNCNNIRLNITINTICSNVLFNKATEIVYGEGTNYVKRYLNNDENILLPSFEVNDGKENNDVKLYRLYGRKSFNGESNDVISKPFMQMLHDTQLSNLGYKYHCGLDMMNNHILRNKSSKVVSCVQEHDNTEGEIINESNKDYRTNKFNTIHDIIRDSEGRNITPIKHLYDKNDLMTFSESICKNISEVNGWFGFTNKSNLNVIDVDNYDGDLNKVICGESENKHIQFYPGSDLFSIIPKYNSYRQREELNWLYYIVYPTENLYEGFSFIDGNLKSLKVLFYDDEYNGLNGIGGIKIYSICKHGLNVGDIINVYSHKDKEYSKTLSNVEVSEVINDYEFVINSRYKFNKEYIKIDSISGDYNQSEISNRLYENGEKQYLSINDKICVSDSIDYLSFKKVINGDEVYYYVRKFTKLDNQPKSSIGALSFAKNIYGDNLGEITYSDSINLDGYLDNHSRPLSSLYLLLLKNNKGYEKWYTDDYNNDNVEYSHAFGKLTCGFKLSDYTIPLAMSSNNITENIKCISNVYDFPKGIMNKINDSDDFEIKINADNNFYGDICCFSDKNCLETIIDTSYYRFNTNQRETTNLSPVNYEEIISSDSDIDGFKVDTYSIKTLYGNNNTISPEGYYYKPIYEIKIKTHSDYINTDTPYVYDNIYWDVYSDENENDNTNLIIGGDYEKKYIISHKDVIYCNIGDNVMIVDEEKTIKDFTIIGIINKNNIIIGSSNETLSNDKVYSLLRRKSSTPQWAKLLINEETYYWRDVIQNGFDKNSMLETYPYQNNCLYVNKNINLFVKRQDDGSLKNMTNKRFNIKDYDIQPIIKTYKDNTYYEEREMIC